MSALGSLVARRIGGRVGVDGFSQSSSKLVAPMPMTSRVTFSTYLARSSNSDSGNGPGVPKATDQLSGQKISRNLGSSNGAGSGNYSASSGKSGKSGKSENPNLGGASFKDLGASKTVKWVVIGCLSVVATLESIAWMRFAWWKLGFGENVEEVKEDEKYLIREERPARG